MSRALHIQDRDLNVLTELGELGILDTDTIRDRHFPTDKTGRACQRRLKSLSDHGLIKKAALVVTSGAQKTGRLPTLHCLTPKGSDVLEASGRASAARVSRSDPQPITLLHRLAIVKVRLALDDACRYRTLDAPEWIMEQDTDSKVPTDAPLSKRLVLYHTYPNGRNKVTCRPDAASLLRIPKADGEGTVPLLGYWEIDRSTESLTQIRGKLPGYTAFFKHQSYLKHWPNLRSPAVRTFFICQTEQRMRNIIEAVRGRPVADFLRFAIQRDLDPQRLLTEPIWHTVAGEQRPIIRAT